MGGEAIGSDTKSGQTRTKSRSFEREGAKSSASPAAAREAALPARVRAYFARNRPFSRNRPFPRSRPKGRTACICLAWPGQDSGEAWYGLICLACPGRERHGMV